MKSLTKVIYKPDSRSTDEFILIVDAQSFRKWKNGDTSIPIVDVVDSFKVFHTGQGKQGKLGEASRQQLENTFGTHKEYDVALQILEKGESQAAESLSDDKSLFNFARGGFAMDNKGSGAQLSGA